jgi:hypothetical protein
MTDKITLTAPCGLDCFNCGIHKDNLTTEIADAIHSKVGVPLEEIACKGCREQDGIHYHLPNGSCDTLDCVKNKGVDLCCDCNDFPCSKLAPTSDGAESYPHNMKLYNLCRIKKFGIDAWIKESEEIRNKYFTGKFVVGKGQSV